MSEITEQEMQAWVNGPVGRAYRGYLTSELQDLQLRWAKGGGLGKDGREGLLLQGQAMLLSSQLEFLTNPPWATTQINRRVR